MKWIVLFKEASGSVHAVELRTCRKCEELSETLNGRQFYGYKEFTSYTSGFPAIVGGKKRKIKYIYILREGVTYENAIAPILADWNLTEGKAKKGVVRK